MLLQLLANGLVLDEDPPVGRAGRLLADFQHLFQVLAGLDLLPELRVLRELVRQRLIEQVLQGFPEVRPHGTLQDQRREQRLEVRLRHVVGGVQRARRRLGADGISRLDRLEQPLRQGTLLILEQAAGRFADLAATDAWHTDRGCCPAAAGR